MRRCQILTVVSAALLLSTSLVRGDGLVRDGVGAISTGRGGTNIAHSDNGAIILDNPAGMANLTVPGFYEIGIDTVITDIDYTDPDNPEVNGKFRPYPSPELAYIRQSEDGMFSYGIGVFAPAGFGAEYDMQNPVTGLSVYKSIGMLVKVLPAMAVRVTDRLSVGATFGVAVSHTELEGPLTLQTGALAGVPTTFDLQATGATPVGSLGMQYRLTDCTTIGVCYQEESRFELDGSVNADVFGLAPVPVSSRFDAQMNITWPRSLGTGIKHDLSASHRVSADVIWYNWSNAFDQFDIILTNSSNPLFTALLGPTITDTIPMNWKDTMSVRFGYEWEANCRDIWRAGYVFHDSPVPSNTLTPYVDGVLEHAFSLGYTRRCDKYLLNLAYQYSFGPERTVGDSILVGDDFSNSTFQAQAHWASASIVVPF